MQKTYFTEEQRFTQPWLWVILVVALSSALIPLAAQLYVELVKGEPFGETPTSAETLLIMFFLVLGISVGIIFLFWKTKLITEVRAEGLSVRFPIFILKEKMFDPETIDKYYIRKYKPIREYGGWGIKYGKGKAYNVKGNMGMQLVFKSGKRLLIGTQRQDAFLHAMKKMTKGG